MVIITLCSDGLHWSVMCSQRPVCSRSPLAVLVLDSSWAAGGHQTPHVRFVLVCVCVVSRVLQSYSGSQKPRDMPSWLFSIPTLILSKSLIDWLILTMEREIKTDLQETYFLFLKWLWGGIIYWWRETLAYIHFYFIIY